MSKEKMILYYFSSVDLHLSSLRIDPRCRSRRIFPEKTLPPD